MDGLLEDEDGHCLKVATLASLQMDLEMDFLMAISQRKEGKEDHRSQTRKKKTPFQHDAALANIQRDFLVLSKDIRVIK